MYGRWSRRSPACSRPRKGVGRFSLAVSGRPAHAGAEPEKGISAIQELAHQILALHSLSNPATGASVNVGMAPAVRQPTSSQPRPSPRSTPAWTQEDADRITQAIYGLTPVTPGAQLRVEGEWNRPPLERKATAAIFARAEIGAAIGLDLQEGGTGGAATATSPALGIPTLDGLGVPGDGAHADHEHIVVDQLPGRAALLTALITQL